MKSNIIIFICLSLLLNGCNLVESADDPYSTDLVTFKKLVNFPEHPQEVLFIIEPVLPKSKNKRISIGPTDYYLNAFAQFDQESIQKIKEKLANEEKLDITKLRADPVLTKKWFSNKTEQEIDEILSTTESYPAELIINGGSYVNGSIHIMRDHSIYFSLYTT